MGRVGNTYLDCTVLETLPNAMFRVSAPEGQIILAQVSGRMRRHFIRILIGDKVKVEMTPYDKERGRVVYRYH